MSLKRKPAPSFSAEPLETYYPGDSAIDAGASDLVAWCQTGELEHLVRVGEEEPTLITYRLLGTRALRRCSILLHQQDPNVMVEAFRLGVLDIKGEDISRERRGGLWSITDQCVDVFSDEVEHVLLPAHVLVGEVFSAAGFPSRKEPDPTVMEMTSLPEAIGSVILARSFRSRG